MQPTLPYPARFYAAVIIGALLLMAPALINGYPIFNPDIGTYLASGFKSDTPIDRPITYGLLLRAISLNGWSLWPALFLQAYWVSWLLIKVTRAALGPRAFLLQGLASIAILAVASSLSWVTSELIPDIYTAIALLCLLLIVPGREGKGNTALLYVLYTIAIATHLSHVLLFGLLLIGLILFRKRLFPERRDSNPLKRLALLLLLTAGSIATMGSALSKSRHVFFMAAMLEQGILKPYLDEHCPAGHYRICAYKDHLPASADDFLWDEGGSPLYRTGGWAANKEEYNRIINGTFTERKYIGMHLIASGKQTARQAVHIGIGDGNTPFPPGSGVDNAMQLYLPHERPLFLQARQQNGLLLPLVKLPNRLFPAIVLAALSVCIFFLAKGWKRNGPALNRIILITGCTLLLNCWDCGTFAQVNGRYGSKMIWLIPFLALLCIFRQLQEQSKDRVKP